MAAHYIIRVFVTERGRLLPVDALEHICPEDWPGILANLHKALKPGGVLYLTVEVAEWDEVRKAYERARAQGLPVVFGELVDEIDAAYAQVAALEGEAILAERADQAVYHYYPDQQQVRLWLSQAGLAIEEEGTGDGYTHLLLSKKG